jgi:GT2 family glycosyltransferase
MNASNKPLVSIITVNYNSIAVTLEFLRSLQHSSYSAVEVIVIDNGSSENPHAILQSDFPDIIFKRSDHNLGFAGGNNLGVSLSKGELLFFVNNDTEVTRSLIENLVTVLVTNSTVGVVSPKIIYHGTSIIQYAGYTGMSIVTARNKALGSKQQDNSSFIGLHKTPYAHGAAMMVKREVINKVGPFPTDFFLYYEELDWCEQIRRAGFDIAVDLSSVIYHKESMSVGKSNPLKLFYQTRNRILFVRRNMPWLGKVLFHVYFYALVSPFKLLRYGLNRQWSFLKAYRDAMAMNNNYKP